MNTKRTWKWGLVTAAATCFVVAAMPGCELLVDFDRSKIPSEAGTEDVTTSDGPASETGGPEAGGEASTDAPSEASEASTRDAPADSPAETTTSEGGPDAPSEAAPEAGPEGGDASDGATGAAVFTIAPGMVNYGTVAQGTTTAGYQLVVKNTGTAAGTPMPTVGGTNSGDFAATGCGSALAPNATCTLSVTFDPGGLLARAGTVDVGTGTPSVLTGTGAAAGTLTITPITQDFGSVTVGSASGDQMFTVTNTDATNAVALDAPTIDGQDSTMFVLDADGGSGQCAGSLSASGTCTLFVHFSPSSTGFHYASLSISGTSAGTPGTASASLTGTGQ